QNHQREPHRSCELFAHRDGYDLQVWRQVRILTGNAVADRLNVSPRSFDRGRTFQSGDDGKVMIVTIGELLRVERDRHPKSDLSLKKLKTIRGYADDRILFIVEPDRASYDTGVAGKSALPQPVAEHRDLLSR